MIERRLNLVTAKSLQMISGRLLAALLLLLFAESPAGLAESTKAYLDGDEALLIGIGGGVPLLIEHLLPATDSTQRAIIPRPVLVDDVIARKFGGGFHVGKSNFLNGTFGSTITPALAGIGIIAGNFTWPEERPGKDALQDFHIYHSGLWATAGVTGIAKYVFARPRPFLHYYPDSAASHEHNYSEARKSFFSGHASSAFYSVTYLNKRTRAIMRQRLSAEEYRDWRWLPPTVLFSWGSYVCWTRIRAYQHYFSDVAIGALAGYLLAELFYSLGDERCHENDVNAIEKPVVFIRLPL